MNPFRKIYSILTKDNKRDSIIFFLLLVFATVFEILSIGLIFPAITILLKSELPENLNFIHISLEELSNYTNIDYITLGLSILILVFFIVYFFPYVYLILLFYQMNIFLTISLLYLVY